MIDLRIWRTALLVAPVALIVAMFSLQEAPEALEPELPPDAFDSQAAATLAADLAAQFPDPRPGSEADNGLADFVSARFQAIPSAEVDEQRFEATVDGEDRELRNLLLTLPGQSERQVALIAGRDTGSGSGAATGIASTAAMLEIAAGFSGASHSKTLVFASTDGGSAGAAGAKRFVEDYSERSLLDAAIVLSQPANPEPEPPFVIPWSTGPQSAGAALAATANRTLSDETGEPAGDPGPLAELGRLALPSGLGEQGPLIEGGLDAVRVSSAGELPLPPELDRPDDVNPSTLDSFGRATLSLLLALDAAEKPIEHGPEAYVRVAGNLLPGWALAMMALALLAPLGVASAVALGAAAGSPSQAGRALGWVLLRAAPFALALLAVHLFDLVGLVPDPPFPFDPAAEDLGTGGTVAVVLAALVFAAAAFLLRPLLAPPPALAPLAAAAALAVATLAALGVWLINPYLCLLLALGLQCWAVAAGGAVKGRAATAALVVAGLAGVAVLAAALASRFETGPAVVWDLLLMFTGGELSDGLALLGCIIAGAGLALVAASAGPAEGSSPQLKLTALVNRGRELERRRTEGKRRKARRRSGGARRRGRAAPDPAPPGAVAGSEAGHAAGASEGEERDPAAGQPEPDEAGSEGSDPAEPEATPEPEAPPETERDPRMWSKPRASTASPPPSRTVTPRPSLIRPT